jgi:hypothetical protein
MDKEYWQRDKVVPDVIQYMALLYTSVPDISSGSDPKLETSDTMDQIECYHVKTVL